MFQVKDTVMQTTYEVLLEKQQSILKSYKDITTIIENLKASNHIDDKVDDEVVKESDAEPTAKSKSNVTSINNMKNSHKENPVNA